MSEQVIIDGELNLDSAFDGLPSEQIIVNVTGAPKIIDKASGRIVSIVDGAENERLLSAVVNIEPAQDLHGYDYPWPAGSGVNKLPKLAAGTYQANGGKIVVDANGLATLSGTTTAAGNVAIIPLETPITVTNQWYVQLHNTATIDAISANFESTTYVSSASIAFTSANRIVQISADKIGNVVDQVRFWIPSGVTLSGTFQPIFTVDATAQPYSPYSNICPISGWTQVKVTGNGKNLCPPLASASTSNGVTFTPQSDGSVQCTGTASGFAMVSLPHFTLPAGTYTLTGSRGWGTGASPLKRLLIMTGNTSLGAEYGNGVNFTLTKNTEVYVRIDFGSGATTGVTAYPMVRLASDTDATYKPYTATPITTPLGQTVYGGTLDVLAGEGESTMSIMEFDGSSDENWYVWAGTGAYYIQLGASGHQYPVEMICNAFKWAGRHSSGSGRTMGEFMANATGEGGTWNGNISFFYDNGVGGVENFRAWLAQNPIQVVYTLETPTTFSTTPQTIKTLLGTNNIWVDAGSMEVEYVADTKLYIQRLTAPTEDDMIANENIASGKFFMIGNDLYLSSAAIVAGETIAPGTNCTKLSLAEALNNINA